jgi:hypothetical protein
MTTQNAPADTSPVAGTAAPAGPVPVPAPPSWPSLQARLVAVTLADQAGHAFGASRAARSVS